MWTLPELEVCDSGLCELSRGCSGFGDGSEIVNAGQGHWCRKASPPFQRSGRLESGFLPSLWAWMPRSAAPCRGLAASLLWITSQ